MMPLSKYEIAEGFVKIVQIKMMDVLYNNKISTLVYFRNITSLVGSDRGFNSPITNEQSTLDIEQHIDDFTKALSQNLSIETTTN